jgi:hypothetical protein
MKFRFDKWIFQDPEMQDAWGWFPSAFCRCNFDGKPYWYLRILFFVWFIDIKEKP